MKKKIISTVLIVTLVFTLIFVAHAKLDNKVATSNNIKVTDVYPPVWWPDSAPVPTPQG